MKKIISFLAVIVSLLMLNVSSWADSKLSALSNNVSPAGTDLTYDVASGTSYNITLAQVASYVGTTITPTTLGLVIGTNVQAYNSNLTAINQALTTTSSPSFTTVTAALSGNATTATTATNATNTAITDDNSTNATMYPTWVTANTGNLPQKTSSTLLSWNPSTASFQIGPEGSSLADATLEVYTATSGANTAHFHNNGVQGTTGGAIVNLNSTPTGTPAAIASGNRLGSIQFGGTYDNTLAINAGSAINSFTTQNWTSTHAGSKLVFNTVPNNSTTRTTALTLDQDQSATFANTVNATTFVGALTGTASGNITSSVATLSSLTSVGALTTGSLGTGFVIGGVTMTLGSDASYDMYYRNSSGVLTRLANGTTGQVLTATTSAAPSWGSAGGMVYPSGSGIAVVSSGTSWGTTLTAPSGTIVGTTDTQTLTNKRITRRTTVINAPGATPTYSSDTYDEINFTGVATNITNMTTNLSGTPVTGDLLELTFIDAGSAETIAWGTSFISSSTILPATTIASTKMWVLLEYDGSHWVCIAVS